jgi:hypothetical protein
MPAARAMFQFSETALAGKQDEEEIYTPFNPETTSAAAFKFTAEAQLDEDERFSRMGGLPVAIRASITRIAFFKLLGTGVVAALTAASLQGSIWQYSCALAAAVNAVAATHYLLIWTIRAQVVPKAYAMYVSQVGADHKDDHRRLVIQEREVDGLRHSDWTVTVRQRFAYFLGIRFIAHTRACRSYP